MIGSGNIDNALEAIQAGISELDTRIAKGEHLSAKDVEYLAELTTACKTLRNKAVCYYSTMFNHVDVAKAFNLSAGRVSQIVKDELSETSE